MRERSPLGELLSAAALRLVSVERFAAGALGATQRLAVGFFSQALTTTEQTRLSGVLYDRSARPDQQLDGLQKWEQRWLERDLPAAPARVLVPAAGSGRECLWLLDAGYEVDAFDPSPKEVLRASRAFAGRARIAEASYADLGGSKLSFLHPRYDAVLLGWGSLSHVIGPDERSALMRAVDALAGSGNVLLSFYLADPKPRRVGRAHRAGAALGGLVGERRATIPEPVDFTSWGGFIRSFAPDEIEALAAAVGRRVDWYLEEGMPHVTLRRNAT